MRILATILVLLVGGTVSQQVLAQGAGFGFSPGGKSDPPPPEVLVTPNGKLPIDEIASASPIHVNDGSRWSVKLESPTLFRPDAGYGKPSSFYQAEGHLFTPFRNTVLKRKVHSGQFKNTDPLRYPTTVSNVFGVAGLTAVLLKRGAKNSTEDLLMYSKAANIVHHLKGSKGRPYEVKFSPDRSRLVARYHDRSVILWDTQNGQKIVNLPAKDPEPTMSEYFGEFVAFSPDGKSFATAFDHDITLSESKTGHMILQWPLVFLASDSEGSEVIGLMPEPKVIRFAPDSKKVYAFGASGEADMQFMRLNTGAGRGMFTGKPRVLDGLLISDKEMMTRGIDGALTFWDLNKKKPIESLKVSDDRLVSMAVSPDQSRIVAGNHEGTILFFDAKSKEPVKSRKPYSHQKLVHLEFSEDGKHLITLGEDGWLKVWDLPR